MSVSNETRSQVMRIAWVLFREGCQLRDGRTFSDCLRWAWRETRQAIARAAFAAMRVVHLSSSLIRSPIGKVKRQERYGRSLDRRAGYLTSRLGS